MYVFVRMERKSSISEWQNGDVIAAAVWKVVLRVKEGIIKERVWKFIMMKREELGDV